MTEFIGFFAAIITTLSFLPQAILVIRTRNTDGISLVMYALFTTGVAAWLAYGLLTGSVPVILANSITLVLASVILAFKVRAVHASAKAAAAATSAPIA
jgi:MtN3 and saliva related transmembrane protein